MPRLTIDTIEVAVPDGTSVLEAAQKVGITIPHFCWHPALGRAGACRVCAVKVLEGPARGIQMSCMIPAQEGMVVSTTDQEAVALRRSVIEWLMINHPHDCPVCDEGGECQLQDFTIAGNHGIRRYDGPKRTYLNQYLGPHIEHEMNRCIQCYRCARFYQEYAGGTDFGVMGRAGMVFFGRQQDGALESPFSGNLADICPTGVFTDKTARYRARYWDYDMASSICPHCSLGCNTIPAARYRELLKVMARRNDAVNGWFICDRGRFENGAVNAPQRPRQPLVAGAAAPWQEALELLQQRLLEFIGQHGPESLAVIGSPRMSLEGNIMAARLGEITRAGTLCYFGPEAAARRAQEAAERLKGETSASLADVRGADLVVLAGCDLLAEAPMMALAVRQAWRQGAQVYGVAGSAGTGLFAITPLGALAEVPWQAGRRAVVVCGSGLTDLAVLEAVPPGTRMAILLQGPNAFGCAELGRSHHTVPLAEALAGGRIKGIVSFEADLPELPPQIRVLAAADWQATLLTERAEVFLPAAAWVEMEGTFVNSEGRAQRFQQVMRPGQPIRGLDPAGHPPRVHRTMPPGGDPLPSWQIITELLARLGDQPPHPLSGRWQGLRDLESSGGGITLFDLVKAL